MNLPHLGHLAISILMVVIMVPAIAMTLGNPVSLAKTSRFRGIPPVLLALADCRHVVCYQPTRLRPYRFLQA